METILGYLMAICFGFILGMMFNDDQLWGRRKNK